MTATDHPLHGLVAEYETPEELLAGAQKAHASGYRRMDAYTPFAVEGLEECLEAHGRRVSLITLLCGITGGLTGYGMQAFAAMFDYPLNVGGRPLHSWPAFIPITFELTILFAAVGGAIGMFILNGLPCPHHPIFDTPHFEERNEARFYLCIETKDPLFDAGRTREFLDSTHPAHIWEVPLS
jgi:hypothetical protein